MDGVPVDVTGSPEDGPSVVRVQCPMMGEGGLDDAGSATPVAYAGADHPHVCGRGEKLLGQGTELPEPGNW